MTTRTTIGIIGGGQLGMMLAAEARALGARTVCLDPSADAPAFAVANERVVGAFDDMAALERLCAAADVVTYEFENVPGELLEQLEQRYTIPQGIRPLLDSQDRLREKRNAREHGLQTPHFEAAGDEASLAGALRHIGFPAVLKTRTLGYDGHGQVVLRSREDLPRALPLLAVPCILEEFVPFDYEASVILVGDGERIISFPVGRNIHRDGILDLTVVPTGADEKTVDRIVAQSETFMRDCGYRGILAIEYFVRDQMIYFNEMAPRPHNSGHYALEGCTTNQFRELARYLLGLPLQTPRLTAPTVMKNVLGRDLEAARQLAAERLPGVHVHLYGKREARTLRKMGHVTFTDTTAAAYSARWAGRFTP